MAHRLDIREIPGAEYAAMSTYRKDTSPSIIRELDKCILCRRCEIGPRNEVQTVGALSAVNRGFMATVAPAFEQNLEYSTCTYCGQCVSVCPTGALTEVNHVPQVLRALLFYENRYRSDSTCCSCCLVEQFSDLHPVLLLPGN